MTYFAHRKVDPLYFTVGLVLDGGTCEASSLRIKLGDKYEFPRNPTKTGLYFAGWYADSSFTRELTKDDIAEYDIKQIYAKWQDTPTWTITVNLNGQWQTPTQWTNTNASFDVYESFSNYNVNNGYAKMYITVEGFTEFTIYINSYAESNYDYTLAFIPGYDPTSLPSGSSVSGNIAGTTYGYQYNPSSYGITSGSGWKKVTYALDGSQKTICVCFRKDSSVNDNWDRGYVAIPKV